jgi:hypothetical protein
MAEDNGMVVAGGVRYTKKDAEARGLKADSAAHAKKIAFGELPVGTIAGTTKDQLSGESVPAPLTTAANDPKK